ncbi:chromatin modification-related protein eaf6-like isoform X4 [Actinidia eriantha]|uniref:chromatin modification-related protein eaf6-like isoform X4 n=1 Tax=Actinidia eriantha TaxID=165200 RepID=UPI00258AA039|nr:chromatin modification-related protein eaf6-like isoform X4 [Actinidia eriantha]
MQSEGKKSSYNPASTLASLKSKREKLQVELHGIENQVYELETKYLQESSNFGNAVKGGDGFLSASKNTTNLKKSRKFQPEDRIFSLSSVTSPAAEEQGVGRNGGLLLIQLEAFLPSSGKAKEGKNRIKRWLQNQAVE